MNRLLLVTIITALFSPEIYAQNYTPKFDEGLNLSEFMKVATGDSALQACMPLPPIKFEKVKGTSKDEGLLSLKELFKFRAGSFYGALRPYVAENTYYRYGIKYPPLLQASQDPVAKELLIQWDNINSARGLLLDTAANLESQDSALYTERVQIAETANALNKEIEELKADIAAFNKQCAGQPVNTYCTNWRARLVAWNEDLGKRLTAHNAHYADWVERKKGLDSSVTNWSEQVKAWQRVILEFIEKAQLFLHDTGTCSQEEWEPLQKAVDDACHSGEKRACKQWNPGNPTLDCATWREYLGKNLNCYDARHNINTTCYGGGNPGHSDAENQAAAAVQNCQDLITKYCMKVIDSVMPRRAYGFVF